MKLKSLLYSAVILALMSGCSGGSSNLLNNPKDAEVRDAISTIDGVKNICMVTEDNDPNGKLNKEGGYTGAVYFRLTQVDEQLAKEPYSRALGDDACEIGTTGGGQIEIYANTKDAEKRDAYLAAFDGTALSDSHKVEGTLVIRLSDTLTASQQTELESKIIEVLSKEK